MQESDCTKEPESGYFSGIVDYLSGSPPALPKEPETSPKSHEGTRPLKPPICPPFATQFQKYFYFCPVGVSQNTEETPNHPKKILIFAPFQPILSRFALFEVLPIVQRCPDAFKPSGTEAHNPTSPQGQREHNKGKSRSKWDERKAATSPASPQKGVPPPMGREQAASPLHNFSRQKISKKSLGVFLKKFSEKFFVGMFRG